MLSKLASLSISSLRQLDDEANNFYDRKHDLYEAALLTNVINDPMVSAKMVIWNENIKLSYLFLI